MARFRNKQTGAVVSVADEKAHRFGEAWEPLDVAPKKAPAKKAAPAAKK